MSFPNQEKLLEEVVFSLAVSINANAENSQIKKLSMSKICCDKNDQLEVQITDQKKHLKNDQEFTF